MKLIILFILLLTANLSFAQGTYTDENTGLTIDYPAGWKYEVMGSSPALTSDSGLIVIKSSFDDSPLSPEDFVDEMTTNQELVRLIVGASFGDDCDFLESGLISVAGVGSYYMIVEMDEDFGTDKIIRVKLKSITTNYNNYKLEFTILTAKIRFDYFLPQAEELLRTAYFSE